MSNNKSNPEIMIDIEIMVDLEKGKIEEPIFQDYNKPKVFLHMGNLFAIAYWIDHMLEEMYNKVEAPEDDAKNAETFGTYDVEMAEYVLHE
jgi:hypothetical protein